MRKMIVFFKRNFNKVLLIALLFNMTAGSAGLRLLAAGQTDRLKGAPFYKTYSKKIPAGQRGVLHLAVGIDEATRNEFFYAGREKALQPLMDAMNAYLDSLQWSTRADSANLRGKGAPYVYVGSSEGEIAPPGSEMMREDFDKYPPMIIHIDKPSKEWKAGLSELLRKEDKDFLLFISLGFSEYPKADKGFFGKKVMLGTGYEEGIKFLSAEDKPVEVLQITAILLDREGNILRAGAEGILHKDTPFSLQIFDVEKSIDDSAIQKLVNDERREDLPGNPLKWKIALNNLMRSCVPVSNP